MFLHAIIGLFPSTGELRKPSVLWRSSEHQQTSNSTGGLRLELELLSSAHLLCVRLPWLHNSRVLAAWQLGDGSSAEPRKGHESTTSCTTEFPLKHAGHHKSSDFNEKACSFQQTEFTLRFGFGKLPTGL